jgi:DNA invertase Pin-like site-specific DNA recombinase
MRVGYARKSTGKQDLTTQFNLLMSAGVPAGEIYSDSTSGGNAAATRVGYRCLVERIAKGDVDEVVVTEFSRVGRDTWDTLIEMGTLSKKGVKLTSLAANEQGISQIPQEVQPLIISAIALGADLERKHAKERITRAFSEIKAGRRATKTGRPVGRPQATVDFAKIEALMARHGISMNMARKLCGYSASVFYRAKKARRNTP